MWHDITRFPGYQIDEQGRVRNKHKQTLSQGTSPQGYNHYALNRPDGTRTTAGTHRLLAETFIPNPRNAAQVNHIDGDKQNNALTNLEWATPKENTRHAWNNGLLNPKSTVYQAHPHAGTGVGFVLFGYKDIVEAGFNHSNFLNTIKAPITPGGKLRHCRGYIPTKIAVKVRGTYVPVEPYHG